MLAAGDTFRAAAVEQLKYGVSVTIFQWWHKVRVQIRRQWFLMRCNPAAARNIDILIADTAGRLQNKNNLMDELKKIVRVMRKYDETAPHEIMLTLDAGTGQNAIMPTKLF